MTAIKVTGLIILVAVWIIAFSSGSDSAANEAKRILQADGVEQISITGYEIFGCSDGDTFHNGFKGVKNGHSVKGVVCSGFLKGATIRYTEVGR